MFTLAKATLLLCLLGTSAGALAHSTPKFGTRFKDFKPEAPRKGAGTHWKAGYVSASGKYIAGHPTVRHERLKLHN